MNSTYISIVLVFSLTVTELLAQFFLKSSHTAADPGHRTPAYDRLMGWVAAFPAALRSPLLLWLGMGVYAFAGFLFWKTLRVKSFGVAGLLWHLAMTVSTLGISVVVFGDKYTTRELVGFALGLASLALLF